MKLMSRLGAAALFLSLSLAPSIAHADPEGDAKDLFARGREFRQRGDCVSAAPLFRRAYDVFPKGLGTLRNLAECEEQNGRFASAKRSWLDLKRGLVTYPDPKYAGWDADADGASQRLTPKVAHLTIEIPIAQGDPTPIILVNDEILAPTLVGTPLDRDPGTYRIRVTFPGEDPREEKVDLAPGDSRRVAIRRGGKMIAEGAKEPAAMTPTKPASTMPPVEPTRDKQSWMVPAGWTLVGVGGASLVAGLISALVRGAALSDLEEKCPAYESAPCDSSLRSTVSRGETTATLAPIFLISGAVLAGAGATILVLHPSPSSQATVGFMGTGLHAKVIF